MESINKIKTYNPAWVAEKINTMAVVLYEEKPDAKKLLKLHRYALALSEMVEEEINHNAGTF